MDSPVVRAVKAAALGSLGISAAEFQALLQALDQKVAKLATKAQVKLKR